jgi:hypothetical protein
MNRALLFLVFCAVTLSLRANDAADKLSNATLPKCTKVEVLHLDPNGFPDDGKLPKDVPAYNTATGWWTRVLGTTTLSGDDAETLAASWRALAPKLRPDGLSPMIMGCHSPGFVYRFYAGDKLLAESSVCWHCDNFTIIDGRIWAIRSFDTEAPAATRLLNRSTELFATPKPK